MDRDDIRARIAEWEARAAGHPPTWSGDSDPASTAAEDPWLWDSLFEELPGRKRAAGAEDFSLEGWLSEGLRGLRIYLEGMGLDEEFWGHLRAVERELLLAWRCLIDARLRRWEERQRHHPPDVERRQTIDIEFE